MTFRKKWNVFIDHTQGLAVVAQLQQLGTKKGRETIIELEKWLKTILLQKREIGLQLENMIKDTIDALGK